MTKPKSRRAKMTPDTSADNDGDTGPAAPPPPASPAPPPPPPSDWDNDPQRVIAVQLALADAMKPIEAAAAELRSPDRQAAFVPIADKYAKAVAAGGDLRRKLDAANANFNETAGFMVDALDDWVKKIANGALHDLLAERAATKAGVDALLGAHERARTAAQDAAKAWGARFADWSAPADTITKIVAGYADQINKLDIDINGGNAPDAAILSFWFEVAPKHLQVSDGALSADAATALGKVKNALAQAGFNDLAAGLDPATARNAGGVYAIAPADLPAKRTEILTKWKDAAVTRAGAEADFKLDPDDAATLNQRWSTLKDDTWIKGAKAVLTPTAS
jgi:hypothetical protein